MVESRYIKNYRSYSFRMIIYKTKNPKIEMKQFCSYLEVDECNQQSNRGISGPSPVPDIC
jgi:hypothetical protein